MAYEPRWRLMCGPTNENCNFIVTQRERGTALRMDCKIHNNAFLVSAASKGHLKIERIDVTNEPPPRA